MPAALMTVSPVPCTNPQAGEGGYGKSLALLAAFFSCEAS